MYTDARWQRGRGKRRSAGGSRQCRSNAVSETEDAGVLVVPADAVVELERTEQNAVLVAVALDGAQVDGQVHGG